MYTHSSAYCCDQILDGKNFKEEGFLLADSLRGSINTGRHGGSSRRAVGHTASIAKKRGMNVSAQQAVSLGLSPRLQPMGCHHPQLR